MSTIQLEHTTASFRRGGFKPSHGYARVSKGTWPAPIRPGTKPSLVPSPEVDAVITAEISGASDDDLRALVAKLHEARQGTR